MLVLTRNANKGVEDDHLYVLSNLKVKKYDFVH